LSLRDVEELMTARGVEVGREAIRCGTIKSGPQIACNMKRAQPAGAQVPRAHLLWPLGQTPLPGAPCRRAGRPTHIEAAPRTLKGFTGSKDLCCVLRSISKHISGRGK